MATPALAGGAQFAVPMPVLSALPGLPPLLPAPPQPASPAARASKPAPAPRPRKRRRRRVVDQLLSNERTFSSWAYVDHSVTARRSPSASSAAVLRLATRTGDGTPELVLALRAHRTPSGTWILARLPMRPNDTLGWIPRSALSTMHRDHTLLVVDRAALRATLYAYGRRAWMSPVGVGKASTPTPAGHFYVRERLIPTDPGGLYGTFAFGTSAYSAVLTDWPGGGVVGIHGTDQPQLIPGRISHGCVRVPNAAIDRLQRLMPLGTPIRVI